MLRAINLVFNNRARFVDPDTFRDFAWDDWSKLKVSCEDSVIRSANLALRVPEVVVLNNYNKFHKSKVKFSRRALFKRDGNRCQYCGEKPGTDSLTIDHVLPRCQGGTTSWLNCVLSCWQCNMKKGDRTPEQANMKLLKAPKKPNKNLFPVDIRIDSWRTLISQAYWDVPLKD